MFFFFLCFSVTSWVPIDLDKTITVTGMAAHLEPTKKEKKFKICFDTPSEGSYLKIKGNGTGTGPRLGARLGAEIRGEDVRITSFST